MRGHGGEDALGGGERQVETADRTLRVPAAHEEFGGLGRPSLDNVHQSRHPAMKELRAQRALRVLFALDPRRTAVLLIGGHKGSADAASPNWNSW